MTRIAFVPTRVHALARLDAATPALGRDYARFRNTDLGPDTATTSALSPYLRRRMLLEREVVEAADAAHGPDAETLVREVFWRTYFKGHLETRPFLWDDYRRGAAEARTRLDPDPKLHAAYMRAIAGQTGIDCFDAWAAQLVEVNWLHNHARMWFASIWIFTLGLPWELGAAFFLQHLIDGDPASNTLSWRWVAGLHTPGKHYVARAENIRRYTDGRFDPAGLNERPAPLSEPPTGPTLPLPPAGTPPDGDVALLLHLDDLNPESLPLGAARVRRIGGLLAHAEDAAAQVRDFDVGAMDDALARAAEHFGVSAGSCATGWNDGLPIVAAYAPVGPSAEALPTCIRIRRAWDSAAWPHATHGFFRLNKAIPQLLARASSNEAG